ncbi:hypothetical protein RJ55_04461 [Drechmeria coniospora]|nr:hypothetical protein RJ55_04461 [Drechmeria coniospora]
MTFSGLRAFEGSVGAEGGSGQVGECVEGVEGVDCVERGSDGSDGSTKRGSGREEVLMPTTKRPRRGCRAVDSLVNLSKAERWPFDRVKDDSLPCSLRFGRFRVVDSLMNLSKAERWPFDRVKDDALPCSLRFERSVDTTRRPGALLLVEAGRLWPDGSQGPGAAASARPRGIALLSDSSFPSRLSFRGSRVLARESSGKGCGGDEWRSGRGSRAVSFPLPPSSPMEAFFTSSISVLDHPPGMSHRSSRARARLCHGFSESRGAESRAGEGAMASDPSNCQLSCIASSPGRTDRLLEKELPKGCGQRGFAPCFCYEHRVSSMHKDERIKGYVVVDASFLANMKILRLCRSFCPLRWRGYMYGVSRILAFQQLLPASAEKGTSFFELPSPNTRRRSVVPREGRWTMDGIDESAYSTLSIDPNR